MDIERVKELLREGKASQIGREAQQNGVKDAEKLIDRAYEQLKKEKK